MNVQSQIRELIEIYENVKDLVYVVAYSDALKRIQQAVKEAEDEIDLVKGHGNTHQDMAKAKSILQSKFGKETKP